MDIVAEKQRQERKAVRESRLKQCPNMESPWLVGDFEKKGVRKIIKARCKLWDCEYCMHLNRSQHYNRVANGLSKLMRNGNDYSFVTITCHENWRGHENSIRNWRTNKDKLLARFRYHCRKVNGGQSDYVYIPETHKDGTIHLHGCFAGSFGNGWWKDNSRESGLGYMSTSEKLTSVLQAVNYCLKYITKHMGTPQISKGFRRINYSVGFPNTKVSDSVGKWRVLERDETIENAILEGLLRMNYDVEFDKRFWSTDDFLN